MSFPVKPRTWSNEREASCQRAIDRANAEKAKKADTEEAEQAVRTEISGKTQTQAKSVVGEAE